MDKLRLRKGDTTMMTNKDKPFTLCIVKDGKVQKEVKVSKEEFIGIMHEQAEGETQ